jgi:hypothetical protein
MQVRGLPGAIARLRRNLAVDTQCIAQMYLYVLSYDISNLGRQSCR